MPTEPTIERRHHVRVPTRGDVVFHGHGHEIHGRVVVVSDVNLEVRCQLGFALLGMAGQPVEITVTFDHTTWALTGHVQFVRAETHALVIEYDKPAPALARAIQEHIAATGEDAAKLQLMLLAKDRDERERTRIAGENDTARRQEPS